MKSHTYIHIENNKPVNSKVIDDLFIRKNGSYKLEISNADKRSLNQNRYYWLILTDYIQPGLYDLGWREIKTKEDAHDFMRDLFLKVKELNELTGEIRERTKSTTELSTTEFNVYLEEIAQWAAEWLHVEIPEPNQQLSIYEMEEGQ